MDEMERLLGRPLYYRMDGTPYLGPNPTLAWAKDFQVLDRKVAHTELPGDRFVSTVWLGLDHSWGSGPPLIFESMVFKGDYQSLATRRYSTIAQARAGHNQLVAEYLTQTDLPGPA